MIPCLLDKGSAVALEQAEYIDDLWFLLHHSEDDNTVVLGLTSYLDDSGSDDGSALVTCGGLLMSRIQFKAFSERWASLLKRHRVEAALHMKEFVGHGKYAGMYPELKRCLFREVATLINKHKLYSIAAAVSQIDFANELSEDVRRTLIGPYAFAFFTLVGAHQFLSERQRLGPLKTSYLVDQGFGHEDQLRRAHKLIVEFEVAEGGPRHTGAFATDTDDTVPPLQAADVISWASRKAELNGSMPVGFEPLNELLREDTVPQHRTLVVPRDGIRMLAAPINAWISHHGSVPELKDIVVHHSGLN